MSHRLSISAITLLIGLGATPVLANNSMGGTLALTPQNPNTVQAAPVNTNNTDNSAQINPVDWMINHNIRQEQTIQDGLRSGALTQEEAAWLQRGEARINRLESQALSDNQLTDQELAHIRRAQAEENARISALSTNNATALAGENDQLMTDLQRSINQQARIDRGIDNGGLTVSEVSQLENGQAQLNRDVARAARDGTITTDEQQALLNEARELSHNIHAERHDAETADPAATMAVIPDNNDGHHRFGHLERSNRRDYDLFAFNQEMNNNATLDANAQATQRAAGFPDRNNISTSGPIAAGQQLAPNNFPDNSSLPAGEQTPIEAPVGVVQPNGQASTTADNGNAPIRTIGTRMPDTNNSPGTIAPHAPAVVPHTSIVTPRASGPAAMAPMVGR